MRTGEGRLQLVGFFGFLPGEKGARKLALGKAIFPLISLLIVAKVKRREKDHDASDTTGSHRA
jgi:hypothetical protein